MTFILELTGQRHRIARREADRRVVWSVCGIRAALTGHPRHGRPTSCPECAT